MIVTCKKCGEELGNQVIELLENKITKVKCESSQCKYDGQQII